MLRNFCPGRTIRVLSLCVASALAACSGAPNTPQALPLGGANAPTSAKAPAVSAAATRSTTVLAWDRASNRVIEGLSITLSRNSVGGPVIAKGKTGKNGKVTLSGNFTSNDVVCVAGDYTFGSGFSRRSHCQNDFPPATTLEFRT
jgi:hypothetical protein